MYDALVWALSLALGVAGGLFVVGFLVACLAGLALALGAMGGGR